MNESAYDLIVVGGGPAGMMAAGRAAERGLRVLLLERGPSLGRKLLLTGGGRCNVTNAASLPDFLAAFGRSGGFLRTALTRFGNAELRRWLDDRGIDTVVEENGCVFPSTGGARSVLDALTKYLGQGGARVLLRHRVARLLVEDGRLVGVSANGERFEAGRVLVACGGMSYPQTGSTGDGYDLARQAGHRVAPTYAAVCGLQTGEDWPRRLKGVSAGRIAVRVLGRRGRALASATGEGLWTHFGVSGPAVLDVSCAALQALQRREEVVLELDLLPDDTQDSLNAWLRGAAETKGRRTVQRVLAERVPARTAAVLLELGSVDGRSPMAHYTRDARTVVVRLLKHVSLHVVGARPVAEAIVTGGGVDLAEVDAASMESKLLPGLHFAGEELDLQAPCGGFNLQAAFSTGRLVGDAV